VEEIGVGSKRPKWPVKLKKKYSITNTYPIDMLLLPTILKKKKYEIMLCGQHVFQRLFLQWKIKETGNDKLQTYTARLVQ